MHASTVVTRTAAGNAELANPAHGLSLAQRRFLTLLDTACSLEDLASRQRADAAKVERDLARLASLGLVACETPAANDDLAPAAAANDDAMAAANDEPPADDARAASPTVRLGPRGLSPRLSYVLVPLVALIGGLVAWHFVSPSPAPRPAQDVAPRQVTPPPAALPATPEAIATKVLVGDAPSGKIRDAAKEPPKAEPASEPAKSAEGAAVPPAPERSSLIQLLPLRPIESRPASPEPFVALPLALPVERRTPAVPAPVAMPPVSAAEPHGTGAPLQVATATVPATAVAATRRLVPIAQEAPAFPREAIAAGLSNGNVKARLVVDAKGTVTDVAIVDASHRAFDRAVRDALSHWRFEPGPAGRTTTVDVAFKRD